MCVVYYYCHLNEVCVRIEVEEKYPLLTDYFMEFLMFHQNLLRVNCSRTTNRIKHTPDE